MTAQSYLAEFSCRAIDATDETFPQALEQIVVELDKLDAGRGVLVESNRARRTITFSYMTTDVLAAVEFLNVIARTAIHATGAATRKWPSFELLDASIRESAEYVSGELVDA